MVAAHGSAASAMRGVTAWLPVIAVSDSSEEFSFADMHNLLIIPEGNEPDSPAVLLKAGRYRVLFDHGDIAAPALTAGNGVRIEYDGSGTKSTPLTWAALQTTGFEIEGLQKVLCKMTGANYVEDMLPCPRGRVMQLPDGSPG
jgi:hypothetical protein